MIGMAARVTARMIAAFLVVLYAPYVAALLLGGLLGAPTRSPWSASRRARSSRPPRSCSR